MRHVGRPLVGKVVTVRMGDDLLAKVDEYAANESISRAQKIRQLVIRGLRRSG